MAADQQRQQVLRQRTGDRPGGLRIDGGGGEVDGQRQRRQHGQERALPAAAAEHGQPPQRDERHQITGPESEAAFPAVEGDVEAEEDGGDGGDGQQFVERPPLLVARRRGARFPQPERRSGQRHQQHRREEEETAIGGEGDAVEGVERGRPEDAEGGPFGDEALVHVPDAGGGEGAEADPLIERQQDEGGGGTDEERDSPTPPAYQREEQHGRRAEVVHRRRQPGRHPAQPTAPGHERQQQ